MISKKYDRIMALTCMIVFYMLFSKRCLDVSQRSPWMMSYKCFTDKATSYPDDHSFLKGKINNVSAYVIFFYEKV